MTSCLRSFAQPASKRKWGEKAAHCSVHWLGTEHSICIVWIVAWSFGPCTRSSIFRASGSGPFVGPYYAALFIEDRDRPATFPCAQSQNTETWPVVVTVNGSFLVVQDTWMNEWKRTNKFKQYPKIENVLYWNWKWLHNLFWMILCNKATLCTINCRANRIDNPFDFFSDVF